eukprot:4791011-Amphidinium_carterae.1
MERLLNQICVRLRDLGNCEKSICQAFLRELCTTLKQPYEDAVDLQVHMCAVQVLSCLWPKIME